MGVFFFFRFIVLVFSRLSYSKTVDRIYNQTRGHATKMIVSEVLENKKKRKKDF